MKMESLSKADLQKLYADKFGADPSADLTKADLIDALHNVIPEDAGTVEDANLIDHIVTQEDLDNNPQLVAAGVQIGELIKVAATEEGDEALAAEAEEGTIDLVKYNEAGDVIDSVSMQVAAYERLPDHKYDWRPAPPKEIA